MKLISGDVKLSKKERVQYLLQNLIAAITGNFSSLKTNYWYCSDIESGNGSPGRKYIDSFLKNEIKNITLPREISMLDIGCGSGYIKKILSEQGFSGTYVGVDVQDYYQRDLVSNFSHEFVQKRIEDFENEKKFDLIISNTALEHIEQDGVAIEKCHNFLRSGGVAVHIVPSSGGLFLYLFHGYRQYSRRRIAQLFTGKDIFVYRLGGLFSYLWHLGCIAIPVHIFRHDYFRKFRWYGSAIPTINKLDRLIPIFPCIYIIVEKKK